MTPLDMEAALYRGNRSFALERRQIVPPAPGEIAIRTAYCGICGTDLHVFHGNMDERVGFSRVIGHEMSGTVAATGAGVQGFEQGQRVVVRPLDHCGNCPACASGLQHICHNLKFLGLDTDGAFQEIWNVPAHTVHCIPDGLSLKHAALIEPVAVACHDVRLSELKPGEFAVVIGSGPIGILVAMVARASGANVLISEVNPNRLEIARQLGFDTVNPASDDVVEVVNARTSGKGADVVFEVSGSQPGVDTMTAVAAARGRIVMVAIHAQKPSIDLFRFFWRELSLAGARVYEAEDYDRAISMVADGAIEADTIITDINPLAAIQTAFESLDSNPVAMKSLIKVGTEE